MELKRLVIREKNSYHPVSFEDIIYLSAHAKKTVIHTVKKDFEINRLLGDLYQDLPEKYFMRVHKSFVINLSSLSRLKYHLGGSYLAFLSDGDDTTLPVGKKFAPRLRARIANTAG